MKILVEGTAYDLDDAVAHPTLNDLKHMARESREPGAPSVTPKTIQNLFLDLELASKKKDFDQNEFIFDPDRLANLQGLVFLARRKAGEDIDYKSAGNFDFTTFQFAEDDEVEPDPKDQEAPVE